MTSTLPEDMRERVRHIIVDPIPNKISTADIAVGFRSSTDVDTMINQFMALLEETDRKAREETFKKIDGMLPADINPLAMNLSENEADWFFMGKQAAWEDMQNTIYKELRKLQSPSEERKP